MAPVEQVRPQMPWLLILLLALSIAALGMYYRARRVDRRSQHTPAQADTPPAPRFTVLPNLDPGEQRIVSGGASRSLDLSFNLDGGLQRIQCGSHVRIGAVS